MAEAESNPQIMLRWSNNKARNWSNEHWLPMGKKGEYRKRIKWNRLGVARNRIYEIRVTAPVKVAIKGGTIETKPLRN